MYKVVMTRCTIRDGGLAGLTKPPDGATGQVGAGFAIDVQPGVRSTVNPGRNLVRTYIDTYAVAAARPSTRKDLYN